MRYLKKFNENLEKTFSVPSEFNILIEDIGPDPTASDIISTWNDLIEDNQIQYYDEYSNKFILEDGESTPEEVFICLNDYLMGDGFDDFDSEEDYLGEGATERASKIKNKNLEVNSDRMDQMRKKVQDHIKSQNCKTKRIGNDFEIHLDNEHIAQVMFRKDYIGVKKQGNKFAKEFEYNELGKIKSELSDIIKSMKSKINEDLGPIRMSDKEREEYERGRRIQSSTTRPEVQSGRLDDKTLQGFKDEMKRNAKKDSQKVDPYFLQEISDRLYGPDSEEYINALKELNSRFRGREGRTGHDIFR